MATAPPVQLSERVHLLPGTVNVVLVVEGGRALVIDSGQGEGGGKRVRRALDDLGVVPCAILTSHAHADHFGGHATLLRRWRVPVHAPPIEAELMRAPVLEPIYLAHGASPPPEMRGPWLMAEPSPVDALLVPGPARIEGFDLQVHDVSGHAHRQLAFEVDDVLIAADAVFGPAVLDRYPLPFGHDAAAQLASAAWVGERRARVAVPGHGDPAAPAVLAQATVEALERVRRTVADAAGAGAAEATEILARVATALAIPDVDLARWHLNHTTVQAHLQALRAAGVLRPRIVDHRLLWGPA
jgi:glyoxylase-like metal-dependent hydrolase (beta-lactamase superfamily II)